MPTVEERLAAVEESQQDTRRALARAHTRLGAVDGRLDAIEGFGGRVRAAWQALARGHRADLDGAQVEAYRGLTAEEQRALDWLVEQRRQVRR